LVTLTIGILLGIPIGWVLSDIFRAKPNA